MATKVVFLTTVGNGTYTIPNDFGSLISVEAIGGGGSGAVSGGAIGFGGGAGGYSYSNAISGLSPGQITYYNIGSGGTSGLSASSGGDTWFNTSNATPTLSSTGVLAKGGTLGTTSAAGTGGTAANGVGTLTYSGGDGGSSTVSQIRGAGGGAAGPSGNGGKGGNGYTANPGAGGGGGGANGGTAGANGTSSVGGTGGNGGGGTGGGAGATSSVVAQAGTTGTGGGGGGGEGSTNFNGANGGTGSIWTQTSDGTTAGPGGGGGGSALNGGGTSIGGNGTNYGGAGGAGGSSGAGAGGQGIIVFTYNSTPRVSRLANSGTLLVNGNFDEVFMVPGSLQFNGSNQYLTIANSSTTTIGSNNFTLECWTYQTSKLTTYPIIVGNYNSAFVANAWGLFFNRTDAANGFVLNAFNGSLFLNTGPTNVSNAWNHIAFVRNANTINCFVNGTQSSNSTTYTSSIDGGIQSSLYVADAGGKDSPTFFNGNITNLRLVVGSALYNSNFTVPIAPLLPVSNTKLLLNTPYNVGNTATFSDSSTNNLTVTQSNNVISVSSSPVTTTIQRILNTGLMQVSGSLDEVFMSSGSIQFNGSSQYLSFPGTGLTLSGANWTMEAYIYLTAYSAGFSGIYASCIFGAVNTSNQGFSLYLAGTISSYTSINAYGQVNISANYNFLLNTWYHVAVTHTAAGVWLIYVNGVALSTTNATAAGWTLITPYTIGYARPSYEYYFPGYISNFRLTIGSLLYTNNFTPPNAPLIPAANTSVLLNTSYGTGAAFLDSSNNNLTISQVSSPTSNNLSPFTINTVQRLLNTGTLQLGGYFDEVTGF